MTNDEMQKTMEFIVNQQAQASAKIDALLEAQREAQKADEERRLQSVERWKRSDERWERTEEGIRALLSIAEIHEREINTIGHQVSSLSQEISNLGETTRATDERLNALINVVERQISEGRNGKR
jgi:chromosome segregation ATPase